MVELQPAGFLGGEWAAVQRQLSAASGLLREGLRGADFAFMFQVRAGGGRGASASGWVGAWQVQWLLGGWQPGSLAHATPSK